VKLQRGVTEVERDRSGEVGWRGGESGGCFCASVKLQKGGTAEGKGLKGNDEGLFLL
jgi:hypothetical protein